MRTSLIVCLIALTTACGGGGGSTESASSTTDPTTNTPSTGDSSGPTTAPTTGAGTTGQPGTDTTADPTTPTATSTPTTDVGESSVGESSAGESSVGESTAGDSTSSDPDTTTGALPGGLCKEDKDCVLLSDCCRCEAIAVGDDPPPCDAPECLIAQCDSLGIDEVSCRLGTCVTEKLNCDASAIACNEAPPDCLAGQLPGVTADNKCWTKACLPISVCNVVPDCALCPKEQMCVVDDTIFGPMRRCEPIPAECMGQPTCACAGQACDNGPYETCGESAKGLGCSCPAC